MCTDRYLNKDFGKFPQKDYVNRAPVKRHILQAKIKFNNFEQTRLRSNALSRGTMSTLRGDMFAARARDTFKSQLNL